MSARGIDTMTASRSTGQGFFPWSKDHDYVQ
jgi:hypothetical protein